MNVEPKRNGNVVELDVRPILEAKEEPFQVIMQALEELKPEDTFILHATINPVPLVGVIEGKGFKSSTEQIDEKHWKLTFTK